MRGTTNRPPIDGTSQTRADGLWWRRLDSLASAARSGDSVAQTEVLDQLRPLIAGAIASSLRRKPPAGVDRTDVEQEAIAQACSLIHSYNPAQGTSLPVYVGRLLKWRLLNYLRAEARRAGQARLEAEHLETIADDMADMPEPCLEAPRLRSAVRRLSPRQRAIIVGIYWRERSTKQLAGELGVTRQAVASARRRAEAQLRHEMAPEDGEGT